MINKIHISFLTIIIIIISILFGLMKNALWLYLIAFIHEISHLLICKLFKLNILSFEVLPFGFSLKVDDIENVSSIKQFFIYIAGPSSALISYMFITLAYKKNIINQINYDYLFAINYSMCVINLLPIYPLDGFNILKSILQIFFSYKRTLKMVTYFSIASFFLFCLINLISFQPMITFFLFIEQLKNIMLNKKRYKDFLLYKLMLINHKKHKFINDYNMFKDVNNYKIENEKIFDDRQIANIELKKIKYEFVKKH